MARRSLLQLLLALAAASLLLLPASPAHAKPAASPALPASPVHATPAPALPVFAASRVHATPPSPDVSAAVPHGDPHEAAAVFRGARRLGPPHHHLLSKLLADAAAPSSTNAPAPTSSTDDDDTSMLTFFVYFVWGPVVAFGGVTLAAFVVGSLVDGAAAFVADRYAAARRARENASRVRPLDHDAVAVAAAGP